MNKTVYTVINTWIFFFSGLASGPLPALQGLLWQEEGWGGRGRMPGAAGSARAWATLTTGEPSGLNPVGRAGAVGLARRATSRAAILESGREHGQ